MSGAPLVGEFNTVPPTVTSGQKPLIQTDNQGRFLMAGSSAPVTGSATWTKSTLVLNGGSQTLLAAGAALKGFILFNRAGNGQVDVDIAGGTVAANTGRTLFGGSDYYFTGAYAPVNAVTIIGTNGETVTFWVAS